MNAVISQNACVPIDPDIPFDVAALVGCGVPTGWGTSVYAAGVRAGDTVVIFGAGAGLPYFSTDTVAAQRALEIDADVVLVAKNGVDGVYSDDPRTNPDAHKIDRISYQEALQRGLKVVDSTAFSLCMDNKIPIVVFNMYTPGILRDAVLGRNVGTLVCDEAPPK